MYEVLKEMMEERGISAYKLSKEVNIPQSTISEWKNGGRIPRADKLQRIADYFGVSVDYLVTGKEQSYEEEADILIAIRRDKELMSAMAKYVKLSAKQKKHIIETINMLGGED